MSILVTASRTSNSYKCHRRNHGKMDVQLEFTQHFDLLHGERFASLNTTYKSGPIGTDSEYELMDQKRMDYEKDSSNSS